MPFCYNGSMAIKAIRCGRCDEFKPPESFSKNSRRKTGRFIYCKQCVREQKAERGAGINPASNPDILRNCNRCHERFPMTSEYFGANRWNIDGFEYECKPCRQARRRNAYYANKEQEHAWSAQRRARLKEVSYEKILYTVVFQRDNGICALCSDPVNPELEWPDPKSGSIDHIKPVAKGGSHLYENVQLAHLGCNWSKGDRYQIVT